MCSGQITTSPSSRGPALGAAPSSGKGQHVGRLVEAAVRAVQLADPLAVDELDGEVAVLDAGRRAARPRRRPQLARALELDHAGRSQASIRSASPRGAARRSARLRSAAWRE